VLLLLPLSLKKFYDPGLAFGWDDKDDDYDIGNNLQRLGGGGRRATTTAATVTGFLAPMGENSGWDGALAAMMPLQALVP
jgi:hypothetical protein